MRISQARSYPLLVMVVVAAMQAAGAKDLPLDAEDVSEELATILEGTKIPGVAAAVMHRGKVVAVGCAGVRKQGERKKITLGDKFHIGSCTKSMTGLLAAIMVDEGALKWDTTPAEIFPDMEIHPSFKPVTLAQLLSHNAGCPATDTTSELWRELWASKQSGVKQRKKLAAAALAEKPAYPPGKGYVYSNTGFAIAGAMMEKVAGKSWEKLMREKLFDPLGMKSAGFGAPASERKLDHPWGHNSAPVPPVPNGDNPPAIGPGGSVHCSVIDWATYCQFYLKPKRGILKERATYEKLAERHNDSYALGWIVSKHANAGKILTHDGSNTMWYARAWIALEKDYAIVVAANHGSGKAVCDKVVKEMGIRFGISAKPESPAE